MFEGIHPRTEYLEAGRLGLTLQWSVRGLCGMELRWSVGTGPDAALSAWGRAMQGALAAYVQGRDAPWPAVPLDDTGLTAFTRLILRTLRDRVGYGCTVAYGELAAMAGRPGAARAVGGALGRNPWPLLVPCHRVVGAGGALTGFTNPCGLDMKRYLLICESRSLAE